MAMFDSRFIRRGVFLEGKEEQRKLLDRREMMRAAAAGAASIAVAGAAMPRVARADSLRFPGMGDPDDGMTYDSGPSSKLHRVGEPNRFNRLSVAGHQQLHVLKKQQLDPGISPDDLNNILTVLWGTGLYIGNEYYNWSDDTKAAVHAQVRAWGFDFVSPKVGGYGSTWYYTDDQLRAWRDSAWAVGLGYAPFIYSIPSTNVRDAQICSEITNAVGIAIADMEDEWAYQYSAMTSFGNTYRSYNPTDPIIVTGYGDPITRFGSGVFPAAQMTAWYDGYSPQWYYGVWSIYHNSGVYAAINWADGECGNTFGWSYPLCPSLSIYSIYYGNGLLPNADITTGQNYCLNWRAPIIWWEYSNMSNSIAGAILGY
jgi:hypothetical protein